MLLGLKCAVGVGFERQEDEANRGALALERGVEALALDRVGAGVVVGLAMDEQDRSLDLVGVAEGRHVVVELGRLPVGALLVLEAVRREAAVVGAALCNAGAEEVGVRQQVRGHEGAVAVAHDGDAVAVYDTERDALVDCRLGAGD